MVEDTGIKITKNTMAFITLSIILLTTITTAVAYTVGVKTTVDSLQIDMSKVQTGINDVIPRMYKTEQDIAVIQAQYDNINKNIEEIKKLIEQK